MADVVKDLVFKLRAVVDDKSIDISTRKIANNSKIALQKEVKDFDNVVAKGLSALKSDVEQMDQSSLSDVFTRASEAVQIFNNRVAEIEKMDSIDSVTAKLYKFEQTLNTSAQNVLALKSEFEALQQTNKTKDLLVEQFGNLDNVKQRIKDLRAEADALNQSVGKAGVINFDSEAKAQMQEQAQEMDNLRNKIKELKAERDTLSKDDSAGTPAMSREIERLNQEITQATSRLGLLSKQFYATGREAGLGKTNADIKEMFNNWTRMEQLYEEARNLSTALNDIKKAAGGASEVFGKLSNAITNFDEATAKIYNMDEALNKVAGDTDKVNGAARGASASFNDWRVAGFSLFRVLGSINTVASDVARAARKIANFFKQLWNIAKKVAGAFKSMRDHIKGTADEHGQSFKQMIKDLVRYSLGIRSLFMLFRRLRKYIKEAFTAMAEQIPEVNAMLASLKSSLYALKGSLATAFEPILSAIAPALRQLIDLLAQAITYIGMFFAALTGRGFVYKANKVAQTIGKAAGAAKELNKQLQGFDELNNLTTNKGSGGGGDTPLAEFEKVDVPDWIKNLASIVKKLWNDIMDPIRKAWAKMGDYVVDAWKRAFKSVGALLLDIVRDFIKAWKSGLGEIIATNFFKIIGDIGNIIANIADKLREAWNYNDNGYKIWVAILKIVNAVLAGIQRITEDIKNWTREINITPAMTAFREWLESLVPVVELVMDILYDFYHDALKPILNWAFDGENSGIAIFFRILTKFNDGLNKSKIRENLDKIWSAIGRFGQTVGEGLLIFMDRMLGYLQDWLNSDDFTKWCEEVAAWLDSIKPEDIADDLEQVWRILKNVAEWVWKIIKYVIDHKDQILDTLETASEHLDEIAAVFIGGKLITDIGRLIINLLVFGGAVSKLFGTIGTASGAALVGGAAAEITAGTAAGGLMGSAVVAGGASIGSLLTGAIVGAIDFRIFYGVGNTIAGAIAEAVGDEEAAQYYDKYAKHPIQLMKDVVTTAVEEWNYAQDEYQNTLDKIRNGNENTLIPSYKDVDKAARKTTDSHYSYKKTMDEIKDTLFTTHPELKALSDAFEENGKKVGKNWDALVQVNEGLKIFEANGGDVKATLDELKDKYGKVEGKTKDFFKELSKGDESAKNIKDSMDKYTETIKENEKWKGNLIKTYQSEKEYLADVQKGHDNVVGSFKTHWDIVNQAKDDNNKYNESLKDTDETMATIDETMATMEETFLKFNEWLETLMNKEGDVVEYTPEFTGSMEDMQTSMEETGKKAGETGENIVDGIKEPLSNAEFDKESQSMLKSLFSSLTGTFEIGSPAKTMYPIGNFILEGIIEGFKEKFEEWSKTIKEFYEGTVKPWFDPSKWTFEGVGQGLKETFEEAKELIKTPINGILGFIEKLVNGIVDGFNKMGETLGGLDIDIPDWVPEIGGKKFELKIPKLNHVTIPKLAQGAVIPPNNEFLAVLGDQKRGTNIETPLNTMVEAFNMANKGGNEQELALLQEQNSLLRQLLDKEFGISENDIYRSVRNQDRTFYNSTGRSGFAY